MSTWISEFNFFHACAAVVRVHTLDGKTRPLVLCNFGLCSWTEVQSLRALAGLRRGRRTVSCWLILFHPLVRAASQAKSTKLGGVASTHMTRFLPGNADEFYNERESPFSLFLMVYSLVGPSLPLASATHYSWFALRAPCCLFITGHECYCRFQ